MEFLMTYGWALLVVLIVIGVLMYSGLANISNLLPEKCTFSISVNCLDHSVKKDSIRLSLENAAGREMVVRSITATSEVLEGPSDSVPGTCELPNANKNSRLKKGSKRVFDLNVRSSATLSATGGSFNDLDFLAGNVMLVRAQNSCGAEGQACCEGNSCSGDLVCDGSTCVDATVSVPADTIPVDTIPAYTHSFDDPINSDSPIEFPVSNVDIPFESVNFTVSDTVTGLDLTLTSQSELPSGPGVVPSSNGYVNIMSNLDPDHFDNGNVSSMNVTFRVERSFVSDNGVSPDDVSLFRYDETVLEWVELDTVRLSDLDDGTYHYYEAIGTGDLLGVFAIALSQYLSCAHIENSKGKNRYSIELVYSWYDSLSINHRIKGELLANAPE